VGGRWSASPRAGTPHDAEAEILRTELEAAVERLTERPVKASMRAHHIDPDLAVELFVLEGDVPGGA
jgi:hypothetical protein